jgi:hypothetical protein
VDVMDRAARFVAVFSVRDAPTTAIARVRSAQLASPSAS